ncbi:efflux RND transporter periplasmic adaptor subunit [Acinetobacter baumannii]|uniref:efflux RND transporter periplasmic adaptor subunit n=3 Tax=Acinetobacter baumannii TaxID=470 RepID=UPI001C58C021|nr:efflux RND transporter periplasmic adaptor subunit [Acinetobacter baumannii]EKY0107936.1 efflux RND transporter periplasmic adaptor subunit [Acinetobacter baumannii]MBW3379639.1 efflux RND transporter periplasmic adaptor subunit [Acinetobacter baumannii]
MRTTHLTPSTFFKLSLISLSLILAACNQQEVPKTTASEPKKIELIPQDLIPVKEGSLAAQTAFTGTIRAVQQSSIQAQVSATATAVTANVGQKVQKGQVLVRLNNQDNAARLAQAQANLASAQAQANLASAQAQAELARNLMNRKQRLLNQGFIARVEFEQSQVDYKGQLESVRAQQANVDIAKKADRDGIITSPISGVITKRQVEPGQTVSVGQTLFEIVNPDQLEIQAKLPIEQQSALKVGSSIQYQIQGNSKQLHAILTRISPVADQDSRQIEFFASPKEAIDSLSIGAFINGIILHNDSNQGQTIPLDSIQNLQHDPFVWVIRNQTIQKVKIRVVEQRYNENIALVQGLQSTDQVSRIQFEDSDINKKVTLTTEKNK